MSYTLVVVDLQEQFVAPNENKKLITNCIREIKKARDNQAKIILVEYYGCGRILPVIQAAASRYDGTVYVTKHYDDGSNEIISKLDPMYSSKLKICGVNTECCIIQTVVGLSKKLRSGSVIEVVHDACATSFGYVEHIAALRDMKKLPNVQIGKQA